MDARRLNFSVCQLDKEVRQQSKGSELKANAKSLRASPNIENRKTSTLPGLFFFLINEGENRTMKTQKLKNTGFCFSGAIAKVKL